MSVVKDIKHTISIHSHWLYIGQRRRKSRRRKRRRRRRREEEEEEGREGGEGRGRKEEKEGKGRMTNSVVFLLNHLQTSPLSDKLSTCDPHHYIVLNGTRTKGTAHWPQSP